MGKKQISLYLPPPYLEKLDRLARLHYRNRPGQIMALIDEAIERLDPPPAPAGDQPHQQQAAE